MAILIESTPGVSNIFVTFSDNNNVFTFSEDTWSLNASTTEFYFTVEVFINGATYSTHKVVPEQTYNDGTLKSWGKFNMQQILASVTPINTRTTSIANEGASARFYIKVGAEYINAGTPATIAQVTSPIVLACKGSLTNADWVDFLYNDLFVTTDVVATDGWQFFTNFPRTAKYWVNQAEHEAFLYFGAYTLPFTKIYFKLYDASEALIASATHTFTQIDDAILINCAPKHIISETSITEANFTNCAYYTVQLEENTSNTKSEEFKFWVDRDCTVYGDVRVYFLEHTGNIGAHTFRMVQRERTNIETYNTHKQIWGAWVDDVYNFDLERGEEAGIMSHATTTLLLNSDWIEEDVQQWLVSNMYISPWIVIERGGVYERATILTRTFEEKKRVNDKLFNEVVELKLSNQKRSQLA